MQHSISKASHHIATSRYAFFDGLTPVQNSTLPAWSVHSSTNCFKTRGYRKYTQKTWVHLLVTFFKYLCLMAEKCLLYICLDVPLLSGSKFIFFTDEKVFTVVPPVNLQNDRVYAPITVKKHDITAKRCSEHVQLSASQSWFRSLYLSLGVPGWYSLSQVSRWTVPTTVTCCYRRRCCPSFAQVCRQVVYLSVGQCTGASCTWNSVAAWTRDTQIHRSRSVASK